MILQNMHIRDCQQNCVAFFIKNSPLPMLRVGFLLVWNALRWNLFMLASALTLLNGFSSIGKNWTPVIPQNDWSLLMQPSSHAGVHIGNGLKHKNIHKCNEATNNNGKTSLCTTGSKEGWYSTRGQRRQPHCQHKTLRPQTAAWCSWMGQFPGPAAEPDPTLCMAAGLWPETVN